MLYLRSQDGTWFGDPIPFYWDGTYHLFYLKDRMHHALPGGRHIWGHFASSDLINWKEYPVAIPLGPEGAVDSASCGTGAIIEKDGVFHLYYLGRYITTHGETRETMCHATSKDLITWEKNPNNPISRPDPEKYLVTDWRDGFPFWNEEAREYWMLVTAKLKDALPSRRGCIALLASNDLYNWELREPFWAPQLEWDHECPDLFYWNGWWYLIYSTASATFYRRARSLKGPWRSDAIDTFDGSLLYAAKSAGNEERRMLFGWIPTREGDRDCGKTQWGGHGTFRELVQDENGELWVKCPPERMAVAGEEIPLNLVPKLGDWDMAGRRCGCAFSDGLSYLWASNIPKNALLRFRFTPQDVTRKVGVFLRSDDSVNNCYELAVEPLQNRFTLTRVVDAKRQKDSAWRPLCIKDKTQPIDVTVFLYDSIIEVFVNDRAALVARYYDHQGSNMGFFVEEGGGVFENITVQELPGNL